MKDTELYAALLHLRHPWKVTEVKVNIPGGRIDVWIEHAPDTKWLCPECQLRIPAKLATHSGDVGHPPERSDAGLL